MRWLALLGGTILAAVAWIACWQQVELARLRRQNGDQAALLAQLEAQTGALGRRVEADDRSLRDTAAALAESDQTALAMQRLRALLIDRAQTISDVRAAAAAFHIRDGSREMLIALEQATGDLDRQIAALAGPDATAALGVPPDAAVLTEAPGLGAAPVMAAPATYVTPTVIQAPSSVVVVPQPPDDSLAEAEAPALIGLGGIGVSGEGRRRARSPETAILSGAGAGIPLAVEPSFAYSTTSPLLIEREQRRESGRNGAGPPRLASPSAPVVIAHRSVATAAH
ncbi:MAG TPA: hypothetical protein VFE31_10900 [Opitutaceae bacterium]|nr:hypothetical protein [Opitutaceae bacterium]